MSDEIVRNDAESRYELEVDGQQCVLDYRIEGDLVTMNRVYVPPPVEGRGIAGRLTRHALDAARAAGQRVIPRCPYVAAWIERHPEYGDLVAD